MAELKTELRADMTQLRSGVNAEIHTLTKWMIGTLLTLVGVIVSVIVTCITVVITFH